MEQTTSDRLTAIADGLRVSRERAHALATSPDVADSLRGDLHDVYNALGDLVGTLDEQRVAS